MWAIALPVLALASSSTRVLLYVDPCDERQHILPSLERRGVECLLLHSTAAADKILADVEGDEDVVQ
jgi:hypothetical protein